MKPSSSCCSYKDDGVDEKVRIGILGTASIARLNLYALTHVKGVEVNGVASRSLEKAQAFAKEFGIAKAYGSYEELLQNKNEFDAVYLPLPTSLHKEWVLKAARAGFHVLVEKPCALNAKDLREMISECQKNDLVFLDAVYFMHHDRLTAMRKQLDDGQLGMISFVQSSFCLQVDPSFFHENIRAKPDLDGLGCLGDLGWYNIRLALFAFDWELPEFAYGQAQFRNGVPIHFTGSLHWKPDENKIHPTSGMPLEKVTQFQCSFTHTHYQHGMFFGTNGTLELKDFCIPKSIQESTFVTEGTQKWSFGVPGTSIECNATTHTLEPCRQDGNLFRCFRDQILAKQPDPFWPDISLATQLCIDALLESALNNGVKTQVKSKE